MKLKRFCAFLLAAVLLAGVCLPGLPPLTLATTARAIPVRDANDQYFGQQLHKGGDDASKAAAAFYDTLVGMYADGTLLTGADAEVSGLPAGQSTQALGSAVTTARDAFYMDYPDLFYVNFNNFAVKQQGSTVYITPGSRGRGYLLTGLDKDLVADMVKSYDAVLGSIVAEAKAAPRQAGESAQAAQVRAVHDALTRRIVYKLDDVCDKANRPFIRTAYGAVVGEGVCEAYARAFKSAMDALDIPCVLVEGVFRHSAEAVEEHMWACVQVGNFWYGVDATMDDPADGGQIYTDYLLAGADTMDRRHVASEAMSAAGYPFTYPSLIQDNYYTVTLHNDNGLTVKLDKMGVTEDMREEGGEGSGVAHVSYLNMGYAEAAKKGYYILARFLTVDPSTNDWVTTEWSYLNPEYFDSIKDTATETSLPLPHIKYVEFGVTDIAPKILTEQEKQELRDPKALYAVNYYQGDPSLLLAASGMQENPYGTYVAPPYIDSASPSQARTLDIGGTYNVRLHFDDKLIPEGDGAELGYTLEAFTYVRGKYQDLSEAAKQYSTISAPALSEDGRTVTFTFKPSEQWAHDNIFYVFHFTGVVGERSGKAPNSLSYLAAHPCAAYAFQSEGYDWNVYAKPQLLDDPSGLDTENWQTKDGQAIADELRHRMTLVVTSPTRDQTDAMKEKAGVSEKATVETYSINLTLCKAQVVTNGQAVRVMLGFPQGFTYDSALEGATFKAYHYTKDASGQITGVNEIPCIVTEYGLLVLCDSFSPFAIVAEETEAAAESKMLVVKANEGGTVTVSGGAAPEKNVNDLYKFTGAHASCKISADDGYTIESILLDGEEKKVTNTGEMEVTVDANTVEAGAATLNVTFAPTEEHWKDEEEKAAEAFTAPKAPTVTANQLPAKMEIKAGEAIKLSAKVQTAAAGSLLQWCKDGQPLTGETGETLTIANAGSGDAGKYTLQATTFAGPRSTTAESEACVVTVAASTAQQRGTAQTPAATDAPQATAAPTAAPTTAPTAAPAATATPAPTATPEGKGGPVPTMSAKPASGSGTAAAAPAPTPAETPVPTQTPIPEPTQDPEAAKAEGLGKVGWGLAIASCAVIVAGGFAWLLLPQGRRKKKGGPTVRRDDSHWNV